MKIGKLIALFALVSSSQLAYAAEREVVTGEAAADILGALFYTLTDFPIGATVTDVRCDQRGCEYKFGNEVGYSGGTMMGAESMVKFIGHCSGHKASELTCAAEGSGIRCMATCAR